MYELCWEYIRLAGVTCPGSKTNRFLIILWWMMTIIVSSIYVAYLVSYLSAPRLFNVVNSLDDLVKQRKIKWTFRKSSALESLFKVSSSQLLVYIITQFGVLWWYVNHFFSPQAAWVCSKLWETEWPRVTLSPLITLGLRKRSRENTPSSRCGLYINWMTTRSFWL